ncbi:ribonuclease Y [Streptacidiphilus fuscans]|uniref:Ribonuclease Y n=1 Tax=Streptacidiphilus fuscans TaxID=2789292 RepID=A0A931BC10_9ACTN|nr:ribonuclease Y [Streptacidiphilus fuscans]MBF9073796.1 ribonuclease Y [Streptacidiphilus fuscans]
MDLALGTTDAVPLLSLSLGLILVLVATLAVRQLLRGARERAAELERREQRNAEREVRLDAEQRRLHEREREAAQAAAELAVRTEELGAERRRTLEHAAGLSAAEARAELIHAIEQQAKREAVLTVRELERQARAEGEARAREIVASAVQRLAARQTADSVVTALRLPNEEMKGRIIGREGRNIRSFEAVTGVNLVIDDTPESVLLSCFDPVRREVARLTLEELIADGRIHPQRIEDAHERNQLQVERLCAAAAQDAVAEVGVDELHPELLRLLGRLRYRTSYGQNVLGHLVESAHIAGMMAAELQVDPVLVKRCTLLHDIGKAVTVAAQPVGGAAVTEGSHAMIGAELVRRYGESEEVVHAVAAHHNEVEPQTIEAVLTQAADACSGGRPGARRESVELHARRMEKLEQIARRHEGVTKVYAMQAGREVRVMVLPEAVDDIQAQVIAKDVAREVEAELTYPGQIRITVIRESRATSFAR